MSASLKRFVPILVVSVLLLLVAPVLAQVDPSVALEALSRLKGMDLEANPVLKAAVTKVLNSIKGTPQFVEVVRDFKIQDQGPALLDYAIHNPTNSSGADALRLVIEARQIDLLKPELNGTNAAALLQVIGNVNEKVLVPLVTPIVGDIQRDVAVRKGALRVLAGTQEGAGILLKLAETGALPDDLVFLAATELNAARWPEIKNRASKALPLPQAQNAQSLPPISELVKMSGDSKRGAEVFSRPTVGCINCHLVNGAGVDFGPGLSEVGTKLGKDALYESILDPSAGIAFGYEAWQIELKNGDEAFGLVASETADELAVKTPNAVITRYKKGEIAKRTKQALSIMPAGLQQTMSTQELVDLVEYLSTLKKRS